MRITRRIPLNPCDYLYLAHHQMLQRTGRGGNVALMVFDVDGDIEPALVRRCLAAAMAAHPVTLAPLRVSWSGGRPSWRPPSDPSAAAHRLVDRAYLFDDLRGAGPQADLRFWRLFNERYTGDWDLESGPQVRLEQFALPDCRTRFCLRWPHLMMDAEGAQWFLVELARRSDASAGDPWSLPLPAALQPDERPVDGLAGRTWLQRLRLFARGFALQSQHRHLCARPLFAAKPAAPPDYRAIHRSWQGAVLQKLQHAARTRSPHGPALYARHLAASVVQALGRLHQELNVETDAFILPLPISVLTAGGEAAPPRPLPGNYLVAPTLCVRRKLANDAAALGRDILNQIETYHRSDGPYVQWAMVWMASKLRLSMYRWLMTRPLGFESLASGFSYYNEIAEPLRTFAGCAVTNLWGTGPMATPPGWNAVFSRFADRLNLGLTYNGAAIDDAAARRYIDLIEEYAFRAD